LFASQLCNSIEHRLCHSLRLQ